MRACVHVWRVCGNACRERASAKGLVRVPVKPTREVPAPPSGSKCASSERHLSIQIVGDLYFS